jgi:hypothetical protein
MKGQKAAISSSHYEANPVLKFTDSLQSVPRVLLALVGEDHCPLLGLLERGTGFVKAKILGFG